MSHAPSHCGNCEAPLTGPYCAQCGQSAHESARSMHALWHDGWHSITHLDGRLWLTLRLLLVKPGEVSRQFIANHRARFLPPFRLYLIVSLVFFGLLGVTDHDAVLRIDATPGAQDQDCAYLAGSHGWFAERLHATCQQARVDGGARLRNIFMAALPRAMFFFLPLIAAGQLLLYWRPRRHYVEHLVFLLHAHAAAFMMGAIVLLLQAAAAALPALKTVANLAGGLLSVWLFVYLFLAMRRFYGQGRRRTLAKLLVLGMFYGAAMALTVTLTLLFSALAG